jgi:hypothetical protein
VSEEPPKKFTYDILFRGYVKEEWEHYRWLVTIGKEKFTYKTGIGHAVKQEKCDKFGNFLAYNRRPKDKQTILDSGTKAFVFRPDIDHILDCLFSDAELGKTSFNDFCSDLGYSNDSIKAFDTYRACMDIGIKLRAGLGSSYQEEYARIQKMREDGEI